MKIKIIFVPIMLSTVFLLNSCTAISGYLSKDEAYQTLDEIAVQYEKLDSRSEGIGKWTMEPMCERYYFNISSWFIGHWLKDKYPLVVDSLRDPSNPYEENRIVVNERLSTRTYYIGSGVEFKVKWHHAFSKPCLGISVTSHRKDALYSKRITTQVKEEIVQKIVSLKMDKSVSDSKIDLQRQKEKAASKRSWNAVLGGVNAGLSTTASDMNRINNNINRATSTSSTPKRWQDMSESEKKATAEKYKYLKGSEVKSKVSQKKSESASLDNKSTSKQNKRDKPKSRYGNCYHYCEGISGKIHDKSTSAGACEKGCSLKHWLSNTEKAHSKCKENFGVGDLAQECHEAVKRY